MMISFRSILLFSLLQLFALPSFAQDTLPVPDIPVDEDTRLITYKKVVQEKGTPDELYVRAIGWIGKFFSNPTEVTRTRDRENGLIKGIARFKLYYSDKEGFRREAGFCEYEFVLEFKEGRYRYTLTNFILKEISRKPVERWLDRKDPAWNPQWDDFLRQIDKYAGDWVASLGKAMAPEIKKEDVW